MENQGHVARPDFGGNVVELRGERRPAPRPPRLSPRGRKLLRRAVDAATIAATLSLAALAVLGPRQSPPPVDPASQAARNAELETSMLQPRLAPAPPSVPAPPASLAPAPQRDPGLVAVPPQTASAAQTQTADLPLQAAAPAPAAPGADAAANTVVVNGVTYVTGREPRALGTVIDQDIDQPAAR